MDRLQKEQLISDVRSDLTGKSIVIVAKQSGVTVEKSTQLRCSMRAVDAKIRVLKNTLLSIAITGTEFEEIKSFLKGPVMLAYSSDPVGTAKVVSKFAEENEEKFKIIGGFMNGQVLSLKSVQILAKLPSLNELRAKILGLLVAPATKIVRTIKEPMSRIARITAMKS
ncbi:MAG: 50S ribosomal protein L10 [Holosporales bacterium]|nr:50S ribosomal protein L10 [Holosporales bacterium]